MTPLHLFQIISILRKARVGIFADIIKIKTMFTKTIFKDLKKIKDLEIMDQNAVFMCISWYSKFC